MAAIWLLISGCGGERAQQACRMEKEAVVAVTADAPTSVALTRIGSKRFLTAWSAVGETWVAALDMDGFVVGEPLRVDRRPSALADGDGGVQDKKTFWPRETGSSFGAEDLELVSVSPDTMALGILVRPAAGLSGGVYLALFPVDAVRPVTVKLVGPVGEFATGMALVGSGDDLIVAWHEGDPAVSRLMLARVGIEPFEVVATETLPAEGAAAAPSLAVNGDRVVVAWSEIAHRDGGARGLVRVAGLFADLSLGNITKVAECAFLDVTPTLVPIREGFGIAYRDDVEDDDKPEFYFGTLDGSGRVTGKPARISRADGFQGPRIAFGDPLVYSAQIRSFQRNFLVGVNRFDLAGTKMGGEFQIYADKSDFIRVALSAMGREALLVYGEDRRGAGRVLSGKIVCRDQ